jgi:hypothetical protein
LKDRPSADENVMRPLPDDHLRRGRRPSARSCHTPHSFRPCRSSRLRRFTPHRRSAGLLHPAAGRGVRHVSSLVVQPAETGLRTTLSPVAPHPSEPFPRPQPYRVTTACYLLAVVMGSGNRCDVCTSPRTLDPPADLKVFLRSRIRCMQLGVSAELQLDAPLGFVPKEVLDRGALRSKERCAWMLRGQVPSQACAQGADSVGRSPYGASVIHRGVLVFGRPSSRRSCHIAVRHPAARSAVWMPPGQIAPPVRLSWWTSTIWPLRQGSVDRPSAPQRLGSGHSPCARNRRIPRFRWRHRSENPASSRASPKKHGHRDAERFRSRFLHQHPCRRVVVVSARLHLGSHSPSGTLEECDFGTALLRARHAFRLARGPRAKAFWPPLAREPIPATPRRRGSRIAGWRYEPGRSPGPGQRPWSSVPGARPSNLPSPRCQSVEKRASSGDKTTWPVASQRTLFRWRRSASGGVCRSARNSGIAFAAASKRVGSGIPFAPRPRVQRIRFGRAAASRHVGLRASPTE